MEEKKGMRSSGSQYRRALSKVKERHSLATVLYIAGGLADVDVVLRHKALPDLDIGRNIGASSVDRYSVEVLMHPLVHMYVVEFVLELFLRLL